VEAWTVACAPIDLTENSVAIGTVKWSSAAKSYGVIQPKTDGKDVFVHVTAVQRANF
jgi:'Cold-shock' DNA-binding domain